MRVYSPSAEVQGHGPGRKCCKPASATSRWSTLEPVGNYAVKPTFRMATTAASSAGITSTNWAQQQDALWKQYAERLAAAGVDRDAPMAAKAMPAATIDGAGRVLDDDAHNRLLRKDAPLVYQALERYQFCDGCPR